MVMNPNLHKLISALLLLGVAGNVLGEASMDFSEQPPVSLMPEARLNPRFDRPASDPAEVMPVGSGDLSAMVRFDGADGRLHLHLSKTDWFAKGQDMFGGASVISPGHVAIALPGLDPKSITGFNQQMDLARGAVTIRFATPAGAVAYDVFGLMNSNALVVSLVDSRTNRSGCEAEFVMWRAAMSIEATNGRVRAREVRKNGNPGDLFHDLGIGVEMAFAGPTAGAAGRILKTTNQTGRYDLLIAANTTYDGAPENATATAMNGWLALTDRDVLRREQMQWWQRFWEQSYLDLRGKDGEYLTRLWYVTLFSYACVGYGPYPPKFNGGPGLVDADHRAWGYGYWWQNTREIIWPMGTANHLEFARRSLDFFDRYYEAAHREAKGAGRLGAWFLEWNAPERSNAAASAHSTTPFREGMLEHPRDGGLDNREPGYQGHIFSAAPELVQQLADYVAFSGNREFAQQVLAPWLKEVTLFYLDSLRRGDDRLYHLYPANAIETWWKVKDPATDLAGMRWCFQSVLCHGGSFGYEPEFLDVVRDRLAKLAPLPTGLWKLKQVGDKKVFDTIDHSQDIYSPAAEVLDYKAIENMENPEMYPVFPFNLAGMSSPADILQRWSNTFHARLHPNWAGWAPDSIQAARLGLPDTVDVIMDHAKRHQKWPYGGWNSVADPLPGSRLGVCDAPYFDSAGVNATAIEEVLLQSHALVGDEPADPTQGGPIRILPAIRPDWSGRFGLLARGGFFVQATFAAGKPQRVAITSNRGGRLRLVNPFAVCEVKTETSRIRSMSKRTLELDTQPGQRLDFTGK